MSGLVDEQGIARLRRRRFRPAWMLPGLFVVALGILAALGIRGLSVDPETRSHTFLDQLYETFSLATLGDLRVYGDLPWELQVARFGLPLFLGLAVLRGILTVFRAELSLWHVRLRASRHVIVVGLGGLGADLAIVLREAGLAVVGVETNREHPAVSGLRARGIPVVFGDATDPEVLAEARSDRAAHVFACAGEDTTNLRVLNATAQLASQRTRQPTAVHVFLESTRLWRTLAGAPLRAEGPAGVRTEFVSVPELAGRALVEADHAVLSAADGEARLAVVANDEIGRSAAAFAVRALRHRGMDVELMVLGDDSCAAAMLDHAPWLETAARITVIAPTAPFAGGPVSEPLSRITAALVSDVDGPAALAVAQQLVDRTPTSKAPILVRQDGAGLDQALAAAGLNLGRIKLVGAVERVLGPGLLLDTTLETIARAKHDHYIRIARARGEVSTDNSSVVGWDELPDSLKDSNRRFADSVATKIRQLGARLVPSEVASAYTPFVIEPAVLEDLAQAEHERWRQDLIADGWRPTDGPKDPARRLHPLLVDWEALPEAEREKDRDPVRELPELLDAAGFLLAAG